MHELSVTQSVLDIALVHAERAGANRILRIHLVVGELSGIVSESVQFYFDFVSRNTPAEGAELVFLHTPTRFRCRACGTVYEPGEGDEATPRPDWGCPLCGELRPEVVGGRELLVESIEVG
ncbi:MAG TPA: hydrogenase maturation nickel metallochaperone HypA [Anaerolineales bacterium]|nr:hydrogenase maturation nickel metallochaperone HypA [Anaerolineae bacterium]HIQ01578.1 hydrogenase maturation nickel metallochaperone HypA [Anaerolineales bacterium]